VCVCYQFQIQCVASDVPTEGRSTYKILAMPGIRRLRGGKFNDHDAQQTK